MMRPSGLFRTLRGALAVVVLVAPVAADVAHAKHKKPIEKSYTATAATPDPTNFGPAARYSVCEQTVPGSFHVEEFTAPEPGTIKAELSGYVGEWDFLMTDDKGREVGNSGILDVTGAPEKITYKFKKPGTINLIACNWAGGPTGKVKYVFTFAK
ncbi:MAG TPA: hypothetical protein VNA12_01735 [Mycobacteriales bacterium]|nr:hypothetical protein [Mycobacteriales bacterium]